MVITCDKLSFSYGSNQVLHELSFQMEEGERVGVIGCNGVGKSTLLKLLCGILLPKEGTLRVVGLPVEAANLVKIREKLGYVFQDAESQLFMSTVYEDVAFGPENYGFSEEIVKRRTEEALCKVHMEELRNQRIYRLSGGEKKLAQLATVLSMDPSLMLLDEPSVALDPRNRRNLIQVLNELPCAKLIASHDLDFVYDTCDRAILLSDGVIVADGKASDILENEDLLLQHGLELPLSFQRRNVKKNFS